VRLVAGQNARLIPCGWGAEFGLTKPPKSAGGVGPAGISGWRPYVAGMQVNAKRLTKDSSNAQSTLAAAGCGHRGTGATAIIEPVLPLIRDLRKQNHSWSAIAAALAKQGVVQGSNRQQITARRLTALIAAIEKRVRRQAERQRSRGWRPDLAPSSTQPRTLTLSADLKPTSTSVDTVTDREETIRRREFEDRVQSLMKKDPS
jgi:hypothetical protein